MAQQQPIQQPSGYYQIQEEKGARQPPQYPQQGSYQANSSGPLPATPSETVVPIKRSIALAILGAFLVLLIFVIGLGAGLGVSQRNLNQANAKVESIQSQLVAATLSPNTQPSSTSLVPTPLTQSTSTQVSRTSSSSATPTAALVQCPGVNNTIYTATTSSGPKNFRRLCGLDYSGEDEAIDIANVKVNSLDQCIEACANKTGCTGAGWGINLSEKSDPLHSCWMKKALKKSHDAKRADWGFAVVMDTEPISMIP
ncbi:hypothetical protein QBC38DRAFT_544032 [Podospora fimiseda]|uniref:Apple domain-containing protein n=1 Tax=Podospora fimiseda TaxID=252190 RepID=A0AAN7BS95_9PEZI|nr:hypothetical protein QBC38DRAFT_544032 [Podospora fimiseda]